VIRVLVTGSNGLLGQKLTALLENDPGVSLIATARKPGAPLKHGVFNTLDVTLQSDVDQVMSSVKPDVVIHTAAMTQVDQCETDRDLCWLNNVTAVEYVAKACERHGAHLVHLSTDFIFDGTYGPLDETAKPNPISHYGHSKLAAEELVMKISTPWTIARTVLVYGVTKDQSRSNIILWVKKSLEEGKVIKVVTDQWRTPTLAEDLAKGCWLAASKKAKGVYNISGAETLTPYDIAIKTADFFGLDKSLIEKTDASSFRQAAARPARTGFIIEKARKTLGYNPHTMNEGLAILAGQLK